MARAEKINYLIIGNSAGGIAAAEAIRGVDKAGTLAIVSDEPYPAYSRPLISEHLAEGRPLERILYRPADFYEKNKIKAILGDKVVRVNFTERNIELASGRIIAWQRLLLATGGVPIVPDNMEGKDLKGVFTFTTLGDAEAINSFLKRRQGKLKAVVIGGGLIGVSATEALVKRGVEVSIVEMKDWVLNTILDEEAAGFEAEALTRAGVDIITGHTVARINSSRLGEVSGVTLDDGRSIACDMVVIAIGVRPRLELAANGVKTGRGIIVDRRMKTSVPGVYACGDVSQAYDFVYGENRLTPVWPNAYIGGRVAGLNMAGKKAEYGGGTAMNALKYFGVNIVSAGMVSPPDDSYQVLIKRGGGIYKKVILKDGLVTGLVFAGDIEKAGIIYNLMKDKIKVEAFKETLVADDFGLASLPEAIWREKLTMPPSEAASIVPPAEQPEEAVIGE
jgi:NAD(P)H-nitrite reductase large subunit